MQTAQPPGPGWAVAYLSAEPALEVSSLPPSRVGVVAMRTSLHTAIITICVSTWLASEALLGVVGYFVSRDIEALRQMNALAGGEQRRQRWIER